MEDKRSPQAQNMHDLLNDAVAVKALLPKAISDGVLAKRGVFFGQLRPVEQWFNL